MSDQKKNVYLEQVLQQQQAVDHELRRKAAAPAPPGAPRQREEAEKSSLYSGSHAVDYHITGFGPWRTVVVPPNVYVVHTRRGHKEPVTIGLGISFSYNPYTDAFIIIPAAMQTLLINANCICRERQGILVQAYVQWIIDDIAMAYRKLDFSDPTDPMRIVSVQLREQAEAAIKDKVATLSINEVLSDKQPIIEELTHRLRVVAEGDRTDGASGLGLKIVTVQIKEAVISSTRLWENLQAPFRAEREKVARLAELESRQEITGRELANRESRETEELNVAGRLAQRRAAQEREHYDREQEEKVRRHRVEQEAERHTIAEHNITEKARNAAQLELTLQELELEKQRIAAIIEKLQEQKNLNETEALVTYGIAEAEVAVEQLRHQYRHAQSARDLILQQIERDIENDLSETHVIAQLIAQLPAIAENMPDPKEQRTTIITGDGAAGALNPLVSFVAGVLSLAKDVFQDPPNTTEA
ncbi:MAG TPA: hypothetical protein PKH77_10400 [Anaerolineae bacterium]|nr:hypothetical protein [Anaerolineae bacterium]